MLARANAFELSSLIDRATRTASVVSRAARPGSAAYIPPRDAGQGYCLPVFVADRLGGAQRVGKDGLPQPDGLVRPNLHTGAVIVRQRDGERGAESRAGHALTRGPADRNGHQEAADEEDN
jgi:hypothetical protein